MGKKTTKTTCARDPRSYGPENLAMLGDAYAIAAAGLIEARTLTDSGERKGVAGWMHCAEKAIGEIIRLSAICGMVLPKQEAVDAIEPTLYELPPYDETLSNN